MDLYLRTAICWNLTVCQFVHSADTLCSCHFFFLSKSESKILFSFKNLFIFGCAGSSLLVFSGCSEGGVGFWWLPLFQSTDSWHVGLSSCSAWAQQMWWTGLDALWHVGSSQTWDRTHDPCIGRRILIHLPTREPLMQCLPCPVLGDAVVRTDSSEFVPQQNRQAYEQRICVV